MALDKRSDHIRFGSRFYTFLDWVTMEKGIGSEKTPFGISWASPCIPDVSDMPTRRVRYEHDYKNRAYPFGLDKFVSFQPNQPPTSSSPRATEDFTNKRERGRSHWRRLASRLKARGSDFTSPSHLFSKGTLIVDLVRSTWSMHDFEIPPVNMLHWWYRSNAQSLELICDVLNRGTLVRVAGRPYRTCPVCYRTCPVWPSRAAPLLPFDSIQA